VALRGTLDTFALPDVLRLLGTTSKSGRLRITGDRGTGSVWVMAGEITGVDATHAPHAKQPVDALFELLRFQDGSFTFDAGATPEAAGTPTNVEHLLEQSESLLDEWHDIELVVPSMDLWVTLRSTLPGPDITLDGGRWSTIVAVGAGATVRRVGDELCLGELAISRAIKDLVEIGLVEIAEVAPSGMSWSASDPSLEATSPLRASSVGDDLDDPEPDVVVEEEAVVEAPRPRAVAAPRARRAKGAAATPAKDDAGLFVPMELPVSGSASYDAEDAPAPKRARPLVPAAVEPPAEVPEGLEELTAAFSGLAEAEAPGAPVDADEEEIAKQLATLSPRAASAIRAAAAAASDVEIDEDGPLSRGLLLKFLSSVKS
jgi:hypothetical protein